jgi:hypothetical protein
MPKFLLVTFNFKDRAPPTEELTEVFNKAVDWVTYAPNCWLLWTTTDEKTWYQRLKRVIHEKDNIFVVEINLKNRAGWLPKSVWEWINKER